MVESMKLLFSGMGRNGRGGTNSQPFPFQAREAPAFPPAPSEAAARYPPHTSSPLEPRYSRRPKRSETQLNYRCGNWMEPLNLSKLQVFLCDNFADSCFILQHCSVDPTVVVACPELHNILGPLCADQFAVRFHLHIAHDQMKVRTLFVVRPIRVTYWNFRIKLAQIVFCCQGLGQMAVKVPVQLLVHVG